MLLDIDNFKLLNDEFGHSPSDDLLVEVSDIWKDYPRDQNLVVRYASEEFLLVLPATNLHSPQILVDHIPSAIKKKPGPASAAASLCIPNNCLSSNY